MFAEKRKSPATAASTKKKAPAKKTKVFDNTTVAPESGFKWQCVFARLRAGSPARLARYDHNGWKDYKDDASDVVEAAYQDWQANPFTDVRAIKSGDWQYQVDFNAMMQTNIQHEAHTQRRIRRVAKGE